MDKKRIIAIGIALFVLILMSFDNIFIKISLRTASPLSYLWLSLLIGIISLSFYTFVIKQERIPLHLMTNKVWWLIFQIGFFNFFTGRFGVLSLNFLSASTNAYINNFIGFITMAMSCLILKEKPTLFQIIGAVIAFAGLRVFFPSPPQGGEWLGIVLVLISITGIAYTNNIARKLAQETNSQISNNIISTLAIVFGGSLMVITSILIDGFPPSLNSGFSWFAVFFTGIATNAVSLTAWNLILRTLRSYEASVLGASMVVWTGILAFLILGENISSYQIVGIAMLLVGIGIVQIQKDLISASKIFSLFGKQQDF